jgi:pimeloyl-ACP methyl ester carboxylesterase
MHSSPLLHDVTGTGAPIVLVPGGLIGWLSWVPHAERLSGNRMVVRVQLRSVEFAESGKPYPDDYGVATEVEALLATIDHLGLESVDLAGWSHGGCIALAFALVYPDRVQTLTLIEPAAPWLLRQTDYDAASLREMEDFDRSKTGREASVDDLREFLVRAGFNVANGGFEALPSWQVWVRNRQVLQVIGTLWDYHASIDELRVLDVPLLAVKGTETTGDMSAIVDVLASIVPRARLLELPGDHASHLQNADRFLHELSTHIDAVAPKETSRA